MRDMRTTTLVEGLRFGECPRWHEGRLWISDFYDGAVLSVGEDGEVRREVEIDGEPAGIGWLPDGRLLVAERLSRRVLRVEPDGSLVEHANLNDVATFHVNDMLVDPAGGAYVGNFGFDLDAFLAEHGIPAALAEPGPPSANLARIDAGGTVSVAAPEMRFPNGMVLTDDGRTLVVAETIALRLSAFAVSADDGLLSDRRVWAALDGVAPDGIALDHSGAIWVANAIAPECLLVAEGGAVKERVETTQPCYACGLGGADGRTLFMVTAPDSTAAVRATSREGRLETVSLA